MMSYESRGDLVVISCGSRNSFLRAAGEKLDKLRFLCYARQPHNTRRHLQALRGIYKN
jgi:hypothetical protein